MGIDLIGVGAGPANLSLAALLTTARERGLSSLSWSGLAGRSSFSNLQSLATNSARSYATSRFRAFGVASRLSRSNVGTRDRFEYIVARIERGDDDANQRLLHLYRLRRSKIT